MNYRKINLLVIPMTLMMLTVVVGDLLLINNREYHVFFSVVTLLYLLPYLYVILWSRYQLPFAWSIVFLLC